MKTLNMSVVALLAVCSLQANATLLRSAESFAVMGGSTVTNTGPTLIDGDLGVWPGLTVTGFPPGNMSNGTMQEGNAVAHQAQIDMTNAYDSLAGMPFSADLTGQDLGGMMLTPGVYFFSSSAQLTGMLHLNARGHSDAIFVFQIASTLITASNASVLLSGGGDGCNVYWQVGSSATLGTDTRFTGNILALASITLNTGAQITEGRALARNGAVTMDNNTISAACIPTPAASLLLGSGLFWAARTRKRA
ncbi:MAG: DUF3494 domain-containing protein [Planctomycetes bacterium]|nr:DUF3494 domain-containing protein [Planctomycetota bacterium]